MKNIPANIHASIFFIMRPCAMIMMISAGAISLQAQQWVQITNAPAGNALCWTVAPDTCHTAGGDGKLFATYDGGLSFDSVQTIFTSEWFSDLHFPTPEVGYVCGGSHFGVYKNIIAKTIDGGNSWVPITYNEHPWYTFSNIRFFTEEIGFVSGDVGTFYKTMDGGITFEPIELPLPGVNHIHDVQLDGSTIYICTRYSTGSPQNDDIYRILSSSDLGGTWSILYADTLLGRTFTTDRGINAVQFIGQNGMACGNNGMFLRTDDGGATWTSQTLLNDTTFFFNMEMVDSQTAFLMGNHAYAGAIRNTLRTDDGGLTWTAIPFEFASISVRNGTGYAVNRSGDLFKAQDIHSGMAHPVRDGSMLFPNPASDQVTMILPEIMIEGRITVTDGSGRIIHQRTFTAQRSFTLDMSGEAAGIYIVQVSDRRSEPIYRQRFVKE